jgi:hypothetical protein
VIVVMPLLYIPEFSDGACQPATIPADHASRLRASAHDEERASNCPSTVLGPMAGRAARKRARHAFAALWQAGTYSQSPSSSSYDGSA